MLGGGGGGGSSNGSKSRRLERLHPLDRGPQALLELGQLAPQVRIIPHELLVHLRQLLEVVLEEGNLLLLGERPAVVLGVLRVEHEQLAQRVQRLELLGHRILQPLEILAGLFASLVAPSLRPVRGHTH
uniref:Uncharacterized protein n=1 Tax=Anopheles melas TaxID=34690 RepID=A0A182TEV5_9DIPT